MRALSDLQATDLVWIEIGARGHLDERTLSDMATAPMLAHLRNPKTPITISLGGYDEDARQLFDIPEAAAYIRRFTVISGLADWRSPVFNALTGETKALLLKCGGVRPDHPYTVEADPSGIPP